MKEPTRWLDDPQTPASLREVLGAGVPMPEMPRPSHARLAAFAAGLATQALPGQAAAFGVGAKAAATLFGIGSAGKVVALVSLMGALGVGSYLSVRRCPAIPRERSKSGASTSGCTLTAS